MEQKICTSPRTESRYAYEAFDFFCDAVTFTQETLGRMPREDDDARTDYHITAAELCRGACELAVQEFGLMAWIVFKQWGITTTSDIGQVIFELIESDRLSKSDRDDPADFHDLFDLERTVIACFEWTTLTRKRGKGNR
jgi:uncharacterized repeat protein (TIGR04138 family)